MSSVSKQDIDVIIEEYKVKSREAARVMGIRQDCSVRLLNAIGDYLSVAMAGFDEPVIEDAQFAAWHKIINSIEFSCDA